MALSVVDLYRDVLPKTNCGDCGFRTCLAFAGQVVSVKHPLGGCPHLDADVVRRCSAELVEQYAAGKWTQRDMADDALQWAQQRSASMALADLPERIGGALIDSGDEPALRLPYFNMHLIVRMTDIERTDGGHLSRWEKVFVYNHLAQGGRRAPSGTWIGFEAIPNTVSKIKTMAAQVESPLVERFHGQPEILSAAALCIGGVEEKGDENNADIALRFLPLPRIPLMLLFWDEDAVDGFEASVKLLFDDTITDHLDIESIVFLSEQLRKLLCKAADET